MDGDGEKENAALMVSSFGITAKLNLDVPADEKQNNDTNTTPTEEHKLGNGGDYNNMIDSNDTPNNQILGKRKNDEIEENDTKKYKPDVETNNVVLSSELDDKPTSDNKISSSDDVDMKSTECKSNDILDDVICQSSNSNGGNHEPESISQSNADTAKTNSVDEMNVLSSDIALDENKPHSDTSLTVSQSNDKPDCIEEKICPQKEVPNDKNDICAEDEADDLLERLDAIDPSCLRKPDLKLEEIDKTDLDKDDLLIQLEEAANGDSNEENEVIGDKKSELKEDPKSNEADSIEQQLEILTESTNDNTTEIVNNKPADSNEVNADKLESKDDNICSTNSNVEENDVEMVDESLKVNDATDVTEVIETNKKESSDDVDSTEPDNINETSEQISEIPISDSSKKEDNLEDITTTSKKIDVLPSKENDSEVMVIDSEDGTPPQNNIDHDDNLNDDKIEPIKDENVEALKPSSTNSDTILISDSDSDNASNKETPSSSAKEQIKIPKEKIISDKPIETEEKPKTVVEKSKKEIEQQPAEKSKSEVEKPEVVTENSKPEVEKPKPAVEKPKPEEEKPIAEVEMPITEVVKSEAEVEKPKPDIPQNTVISELAEEKMEIDGNDTTVSQNDESLLDISMVKHEDITYRIKTSISTNNVINHLSVEINDKSDAPKDTQPTEDKSYKMQGTLELCNFFVDYFTKMKKALQKENVSDSSILDSSFESPQKGKSFSRSKGNNVKKQAKNLNTSTPTTKGADEFVVPASDNLYDAKKYNINVLARWVDKKFYAGKILQSKGGNKYVVQFEDGATKTLSTDAIIFGNDISLPLLDQFVHAVTNPDEYEPGLVTAIDIEDGNVIYTVMAESKTVQVPGTDIYLDLDQAKAILDIQKENPPTIDKDALKSEISTTQSGRTREKRISKGGVLQSPTPGFSGGVQGKKGGRRGRRPTPHSESSDISDIVDSEPNSPEQQNALEGVDGVQPELQSTPKESELNKITLLQDYINATGETDKSLDDLLGPIPANKSLFRNKHFILTCTIPMKTVGATDAKDDLKNKHKKFTKLPFIKEHLRSQIIEGGGKVYEHFEDIPKNKYKQCKIIAPNPCITAKYIQCLAAEIPAISHEWIIESCQKGVLAETKAYALPSGWSIIEESYIKWAVGRSADQRTTINPFSNQIILMASFNKDFIEFWTRVCKLAGATIRVIKSITDVNQGLQGVMLTDEDFPQEIKLKAEHFNIPIVSNVWVVQSLILGKPCKPDSHEKFQRNYQDDDF